jgi:hypothetical protein
MCIECYYDKCPFHSIHADKDEGPYCYEDECRASEEQLQIYDEIRKSYLQENKINSSI